MTDPRDELWAIACGLSPRHQSQLKLLARQARRNAGRARRWWHFEADYGHPLEIPAARRLVFSTWRLRPLACAVHDTLALAVAVLLCARFQALPAAAGLNLLSVLMVMVALAVMGRRIGAALRLMRG